MSIFLYKQTKTSEEVSPSLPFDYKVQLKVIARRFFLVPLPNTAPTISCRAATLGPNPSTLGRCAEHMMELNAGLVSPIHLHKYITLRIKEPVH